MKFAYYPGCSVSTSAVEYDMSTREVFKALGIELLELEDWSCCGASAVYNVDQLLASALSARNLAIADKSKMDIVTPCPACYFWLWKTRDSSKEDEKLMEKINRALGSTGLRYAGEAEIRHIIDILANDVSIEGMAKKVVKKLDGIKVAPYYGCIIVKPPRKKKLDSPEAPVLLDKILSATGAAVVNWNMKTACCGGPNILTNESAMLKLTHEILTTAKKANASCVATLCPQCNMALDTKQKDVEKAYNEKIDMPVLYFTQLIGLSFGIDPKKLGFDKNVVSTKKLLESLSARAK